SSSGVIARDQTVSGAPITLRGYTPMSYAKGLGVTSNSEVDINLGSGYGRFESDIGLDRSATTSSVVVHGFGDGRLLYQWSANGLGSTNHIDVSVAGVNTLSLVETAANGSIGGTPAIWADPRLISDTSFRSLMPNAMFRWQVSQNGKLLSTTAT